MVYKRPAPIPVFTRCPDGLNKFFSTHKTSRHSLLAYNRDRETPHDVSPPTPPGIRVTYHGGSNLFKFHLAASSGSPKFLKYLFGSAR